MRRRLLLGAALTLSLSLPAHAELLPRAGKADPRIREVAYNADQVVAIDASYGTSTMIVLQDDEKIETLALGDSVAWKVEPNHKGNIIFVKPVEKNATRRRRSTGTSAWPSDASRPRSDGRSTRPAAISW